MTYTTRDGYDCGHPHARDERNGLLIPTCPQCDARHVARLRGEDTSPARTPSDAYADYQRAMRLASERLEVAMADHHVLIIAGLAPRLGPTNSTPIISRSISAAGTCDVELRVHPPIAATYAAECDAALAQYTQTLAGFGVKVTA